MTEPRFSFPTWFFDYDNDGWQDLMAFGYAWSSAGDQAHDYLGISHPAELPRLYHNNRDGTFADVTRVAKVNRLLLTMGCNFGDLDNDGYRPVSVAAGADLTPAAVHHVTRPLPTANRCWAALVGVRS